MITMRITCQFLIGNVYLKNELNDFKIKLCQFLIGNVYLNFMIYIKIVITCQFLIANVYQDTVTNILIAKNSAEKYICVNSL